MAQRNPIPTIADPRNDDAPEIDPTAPYVPRTELGRRLMALRQEIVRSGAPLLDWDDIEREVAERRGGVALTEFEDRTPS